VIGVGCVSSRPAIGRLAEDAGVTVEFLGPIAVPVRTATGDSVEMVGVTKLGGRVVRATDDTLYLRVTSASGPEVSRSEVPVGGVASVVRRPGTQIRRRQFDGVATIALVLVTAVVLVTALGYYMSHWEEAT
jgi:hypothetical protein